MKSLNYFPPTKVEVKSSPGKGLGVFATHVIEPDEIIEVTLLLTIPDLDITGKRILDDYVFVYPRGNKSTETVVVLGYGSIYNHSDTPNATWANHPSEKAFNFTSIKKILPGEEICTYYGDQEYWNSRESTPDSMKTNNTKTML